MAYQPYGQAAMQAPMSVPRQSYKAFGITYICIRGILLLIVTAALMLLGGVILGIDDPGSSKGSSDVAAIMGVVILFVILWLAYVIAAGVMAIKGMIAGVFMGLADAALISLLNIAQLGIGGGDAVAGTMCGLAINVILIILAVFALKQRYGKPMPGQPAYAMQRQYGAPPQQYGGPGPQYRSGPQQGYAPAPQAGYAPATQQGYAPTPQAGYASAPQQGYTQGQQAGYVPPAPPQSRGDATSAVVPSPKMAALGILVLAASVDPDLSQEALNRARAVAAKLLGPAAQARIQRQLAAPVQVMDVDTDLVQHTMILNQQSNDAMKVNVIKAAEYVLKGPNGVEGLGEQFMATLKQQLGV
jgi:hypothetical protein